MGKWELDNAIERIARQKKATRYSTKQANLGIEMVVVSSTTTTVATPLNNTSADVVCILVLIQNDDCEKRKPAHKAAMTMQQP